VAAERNTAGVVGKNFTKSGEISEIGQLQPAAERAKASISQGEV